MISLGSFFLAALCKEPALTLPLLLGVYDYCYRGKVTGLSYHAKRHLPFLAIAAGYILVRIHALEGFAPAKAERT